MAFYTKSPRILRVISGGSKNPSSLFTFIGQVGVAPTKVRVQTVLSGKRAKGLHVIVTPG